LSIDRKFALAVAAYAVLGLLAWQTLSSEPIRMFDLVFSLRTATLFIVGLFGLRTLLYFWRVRIDDDREEEARGKRPSAAEQRSDVSPVEAFADVAQLVEHSLGKGEVTSSILVIGSRDLEIER
jgi:hypothetical protein